MQDPESKPKLRRKKIKVTKFPTIPDKLYFSIGEAGKLCSVKPYVIRFWEQAFPMLNPAKLRCGRRYYRREEILLIRTIRTLLYEQGFTIEGACLQLHKDKASILTAEVANLEAAKSSNLAASTDDCNYEDKAKSKNELLKEVAGRIGDILSLLEAKPEINTA